MSDDEYRTPGWMWVVIYLLIIAGLGGLATGGGSQGNGNDDDGCTSGVSTQGCFP